MSWQTIVGCLLLAAPFLAGILIAAHAIKSEFFKSGDDHD